MNDQRTFPAMLRQRATIHPARPAVVYLDEAGGEQEITYGQLWQRCLDVAAELGKVRLDERQLGEHGAAAMPPHESGEPARAQSRVASHSPRVMLLFPPGIDFVPALIGAQLAGWIPVPTVYPKPHRAMPRLSAAARDCRPSAILSDRQTLQTIDRSKLDPTVVNLPCIAVDAAINNDIVGMRVRDPASHTADAQLSFPALPDNTAEPDANAAAFLQYTSGSTSDPKGVIISQRNLMTNLETIRTKFALDWQRDDAPELTTAVFWLPHYHDMGLIGGILTPLYIGIRTVLMSPQTFVRRPIRWLQAVSRYRACITGAPNFAFELCADRISPQQAEQLDLSSLKVMFCGAEPIQAAALRGFATRMAAAGFPAHSYYPCYGLAESTLLVAGGDGPAVPTLLELDRGALREGRVRVLPADAQEKGSTLVSCGSAAGEMELLIVDPSTRMVMQEDQIGEIWLRGASVSSGYWNRPQENAVRFGAAVVPQRPGLASRLFSSRNRRRSPAGSVATGLVDNRSHKRSDNGDAAPHNGGFFRTGDLGFLHRGELFISGRLGDVIIIRGRNYFPQDIEATVSDLPDISLGRVAAVAVAGPRGETLAVIAEVARQTPPALFPAITRQIRRTVIEEHEVDPRQVLLVRLSTIPVTTSGKLQRGVCRQWLASDFRGSLHRWQRSGAESPPMPLPSLPVAPGEQDVDAISETMRHWIIQWLITRGGIEPDQIETSQSFEDYGLDSLMAIELIGDLEDCCDVELTPSVASDHPSIDMMAALIAAQLCGLPEGDYASAVAASSGQRGNMTSRS